MSEQPMEIPVKRSLNERRPSSHPRKGAGNSGASKKKMPLPKGEHEAAQAATVANKRALVLVGGRHRRFVRLTDLER